ncbi:hypothetical protein BASA81_007066 [Batrachochytrium salamandrivorans]|nr:hypothetical protein BASA81_007066 [Batrachochytrium salamandrivorans]
MGRRPTKIEEEDEEIESSSDDSEVEEEDNLPMQNLASELYPDSETATKKPRKQVSANLLPGKESEFTSSRHAFVGTGKLNLSDLLDEDQVSSGMLKKQLSTRNDSKLLLQPLVKPTEQVKAERKLGYTTVKDTVTAHWQDLVVENKSLKLQFPLKVHHTAVLQSSGLGSEKEIIASEELGRNETEMDDTAKAKMRALLFYAEQKSKRVSKIKSKTFRKLRKKKLYREEEEALERLRETDPELAREEDERQAMQRAKERASLRQKNTSKRMRELGKRNKGATALEMQSKMKSIHGNQGSDEEDDSDVDVEEMARRHVESFEQGLQLEDKGLGGMKFMQRALEREHVQAKEDAVQLLKRLRGENDEEENVQAELHGKRKFGASKVEERATNPMVVDHARKLFEEVVPVVVEEKKVIKPLVAPTIVVETKNDEEKEDNPWLVGSVTLRNNKASKTLSSSTTTMQLAQVMERLPEKQPELAEEQRELVKRAFANVAEVDFAQEKLALEEKKLADAAVPTIGAGWGSWTGLGVQVRKQPLVVPTPASLARKPQDQRANVIVSHRTNKLHRKYQVDSVPYPFTSREQYERSLQDAVGLEWNTTLQHEKKTMPMVQVKAGTVIQPIALPKSKKHQELPPKKKQRFASRKQMF